MADEHRHAVRQPQRSSCPASSSVPATGFRPKPAAARSIQSIETGALTMIGLTRYETRVEFSVSSMPAIVVIETCSHLFDGSAEFIAKITGRNQPRFRHDRRALHMVHAKRGADDANSLYFCCAITKFDPRHISLADVCPLARWHAHRARGVATFEP